MYTCMYSSERTVGSECPVELVVRVSCENNLLILQSFNVNVIDRYLLWSVCLFVDHFGIISKLVENNKCLRIACMDQIVI